MLCSLSFYICDGLNNVGTGRVNGTEGSQHLPPFTQKTWKWAFYVHLLEIKRYLRYYEEIPILKSHRDKKSNGSFAFGKIPSLTCSEGHLVPSNVC